MFMKYSRVITFLLLGSLVISLFLYPTISIWISITLLVFTLLTIISLSIRQNLLPYKLGQLARLKFARNVLIDILGFLLTIGAASFLGGLAGKQLGEVYNLWIGLIAGMAAAFLTAWLVRKLWNRLIRTGLS